MTILDVITGETLIDFKYEKDVAKDFEFLEQFNEKLLIKYRGDPLIIKDTLTNRAVTIPGF